MASTRIIPSDVFTAHEEYSVMPTKYRLSKTFTGSACHCERSGGPDGCEARCPLCVGAGDAAGGGAVHNPNIEVCSCPAAALAAATCVSASLPDCASNSATTAHAFIACLLNSMTDSNAVRRSGYRSLLWISFKVVSHLLNNREHTTFQS